MNQSIADHLVISNDKLARMTVPQLKAYCIKHGIQTKKKMLKYDYLMLLSNGAYMDETIYREKRKRDYDSIPCCSHYNVTKVITANRGVYPVDFNPKIHAFSIEGSDDGYYIQGVNLEYNGGIWDPNYEMMDGYGAWFISDDLWLDHVEGLMHRLNLDTANFYLPSLYDATKTVIKKHNLNINLLPRLLQRDFC